MEASQQMEARKGSFANQNPFAPQALVHSPPPRTSYLSIQPFSLQLSPTSYNPPSHLYQLITTHLEQNPFKSDSMFPKFYQHVFIKPSPSIASTSYHLPPQPHPKPDTKNIDLTTGASSIFNPNILPFYKIWVLTPLQLDFLIA